jgi:hypothetical protein
MTVALAKATLQEIDSKPGDPQPVGDPIAVQFNPTTLRLQLANNVDMKKAFGRPSTQYEGTSSATLSFDLVFDTADEGETGKPVDVRKWTRRIEKFLLPAKGTKAVPPRVKFSFGPSGESSFELIGVMTGLNEDFDLFDATGVPVRAKLSVTIKEQRPEFDAGKEGPAANTGAAAQDAAGLVPGGAAGGRPAPDRTGTALAGESAADFADRMGLDPQGWKGLDLGLLDPLALAAGAEIGFSASVGLEVGLSADFSVGASIDTPVPAAGQIPDPAAVTAAGGLQRVLDDSAGDRAARAAEQARAEVGAPPSAEVAVPQAASAHPVPVAAEPPRVPLDPRAVSYGFGVPLRERVAAPSPYGTVPRTASGPVGLPPVTDDPTIPGWEALPL